jgi:thiamine biosynthesis lipoprotein
LALHSFQFDALGTECALHLYAGSADIAEAAAEAAMGEVYRIECRYSRYRADSELSAINRAAASGSAVDVDEETAALLDYAFAAYHISGGLFDITSGILRRAWDFNGGRPPEEAHVAALLPDIGMDKLQWASPRLRFRKPGLELDFGGIGKEYAADRVAAVCQAHGVRAGLVDLGGDILALGPREDGMPWRVGIRNPRSPGEAVSVVELSAGALATSGDYERFIDVDGKRYCHILNPRTGWPVDGLSSVSVQAEQCLFAGSLATIAMLMGESGKTWLAGLGIRHCWVDSAGRLGGTLIA